LRLGEINLEAERRLSAQLPADRCWVLITGDNPGAVPQPAEHNRRARRRLRDQLAQGGWRWLPTQHLDPQGRWPREYGCCVADLPRSEADALMQAHGQLAVVWWPRGAAPQLYWAQAAAG
jgi:hypothetical protein